MAHTGLFVAPVTGTPPVGMSPTDGRLVMGGLFQIASQLVAGGGYTPSASVMQLTVNQAVWSLTDVTNAAAVFFSPTDATTLTFAAAPGSGGRIDLVVVKQNNVENADADSRVNISVVTGVASGSPVAPAVPAGASKYLQVLINAGVTNIAAATITNSMQSTFAEPQLQIPTIAGAGTVVGVPTQLMFVTSDPNPLYNGIFQWSPTSWNGSNWIPVAGAGANGNFTPTGIYSAGSPTPQVIRTGNRVFLEGLVSSSSATFVAGTQYTLGSIPAIFAPPSTRNFSCTANATAVAAITIATSGAVTMVLNTGFTGALTLSLDGPNWRI